MDQKAVQGLIEMAIGEGAFPGAVYLVAQGDSTWSGFAGRYTYCPESLEVSPDTIWDLASISKVVSTTTLVMRLVETGRFELDQPVAKLLPEFGQNGKSRVTFRNLMVHNSGLVAFRPYQETCQTPDQVRAAIFAEPLTYATGTQMVYSDLSMIVVAWALEKVLGVPLDVAFHREIAEPLGLRSMGYFRSVGPGQTPTGLDPLRCAPTETAEPWRLELRRQRTTYRQSTESERLRARGTSFPDQDRFIQGEVHDPTAMVLGGVAGHAGLFGSGPDLLRFMRALCAGRLAGKGLVSEFTRKQSELSSRALGWDTKSPEGSSAGTRFGPRSFGHTGYTGTSVWVDPDRDVIAILLTNRVHPTSSNTQLLRFRPKFHDAVAQSLGF